MKCCNHDCNQGRDCPIDMTPNWQDWLVGIATWIWRLAFIAAGMVLAAAVAYAWVMWGGK